MRKQEPTKCQDKQTFYPDAGSSGSSSASASLSGAFNDPIIRNALMKVRKDKRTIKDSHWLRPENH